jgi:multiple sugar transport system substrate-binding protein
MMRRALLAAVVLAAAALAGCGGGGHKGPTTLTLWARSDESSFIQGVVDGFNRSHPGVQVKLTVIPTANFVQKLGLAVAGGSGPDLASIDLVFVPFFASAGVLSDITKRARALPYRGRFDRAHMGNATYHGRLYALPFSGDASVLFYNTDLFKAAGLDPSKPPRTWGQMEADARKVTASGHNRYGYYFSGACGGCAVFTFMPLVWASGGRILAGPPDHQRPALTGNRQLAGALRFYRRMVSAHLVPPQAANDAGATQFTPFESGKVAMFSTGSFGVSTFRQDAPHLHWRVTPIPGEHGGSAAFAGGDEIAITKGTDHPGAAWEFIRWATSAPVQQKYFGAKGVIPIRRDVAERTYATKGPAFRTLAHALFSGRVVYSVQENALINDSTGPWSTMLERAWFGGQIQPATSQAQTVMSNILTRG